MTDLTPAQRAVLTAAHANIYDVRKNDPEWTPYCALTLALADARIELASPHREAITHLLQFLADRKHANAVDPKTFGPQVSDYCWTVSDPIYIEATSYATVDGELWKGGLLIDGDSPPVLLNPWKHDGRPIFRTEAEARAAQRLENAVKYLEEFQ